MVYTIYKTINTLNGKFYIGKHQTVNPSDEYLGSGNGIKTAIEKYGRENFIKEVLFVFETEEEMNQKEKELLTEEFISSNENYNEGVGGEGGPHFKGKKHSLETKKRIREKLVGSKLSDEAKQKISDANRKRKLSEATRLKLSLKSKNRFQSMTEEDKKKFSDFIKAGLKK